MKKHWPRIRQRRRGARVDYCIDLGLIEGKRKQEFRVTLEEAKKRAAEIRIEYDRLGALAATLTHQQMLAYARAETRLATVGATIEDAVTALLSLREQGSDKTVAVVQSELLAAQQQDGLRPASIHSTRTRYTSFLAEYGEQSIRSLTTNAIEDWLAAQDYGLQRRANVIRYLHVLFSFAAQRSYIETNPCAKLRRPKVPYKVPTFITADKVESLMMAAQRHRYAAVLVPKFAIGFFAGIRPEEADRLDWSDVGFDTKTIRLRSEVTKCGIPRLVPMSDNLVTWLLPYRKSGGSLGLHKKAFGIHRRNLMAAVGIEDWPNSAWRHTFATFHLAHHEDPQETARVMGHIRGVELLYRRYANGLVGKGEAQRFWSITPSTGEEKTLQNGETAVDCFAQIA